METNKELEAIQSKLQKLIRLQESALKLGNEEEANNAASKIQVLLTKYNLSLADIDTRDQTKQKVGETFESWYKYKFIGGEWEFQLMRTICKWNFCKCFIHGDRKDRRMLILGLDQNVETVKWLHGMLCERFVAIGKEKYKEYQTKIEYQFKPIGLDTYLRSYLMGASVGLNAKFKKESEAAKVADQVFSTQVTALVVRNDAAIDEYVASKYKTFTGRQQKTKITGAFIQGHREGENTKIHKAVNESKNEQANKVKMIS